jgi:hypothetical protein
MKIKKIKNILSFKVFHPSQWAHGGRPTFKPEILNPPTWRENQINNAKIDRDYENSVKAKSLEKLVKPIKNASWVDKYDNDSKVTN